jgi:hypothetical protein
MPRYLLQLVQFFYPYNSPRAWNFTVLIFFEKVCVGVKF